MSTMSIFRPYRLLIMLMPTLLKLYIKHLPLKLTTILRLIVHIFATLSGILCGETVRSVVDMLQPALDLCYSYMTYLLTKNHSFNSKFY